MTSERTYMPAAGRDLFLPLYDPLTKLFGITRLHRMLLEHAGLQPHFKVLDIGCGTGAVALMIKQMHPTVDVVGLDPDANALARAQRKASRAGVSIRFDRGFADALPYEPDVFDRVFSSMMFHHLRRSERETALREVRRVLKPAGRLEFLDLVSTGRSGHGLLARILHPPKQLDQNADARLLDLMSTAGFERARRVADRNTIVGAIGLYQASVPATA
jgi:ubiquinone/menaquinone biosynthesis C-methylase UbiE